MHRRKKFRFAIIAVAAVMLLMALSGNGQHAAWMQGYTTGLAAATNAAAEGTTAAAPMVAHAELAHHGMHSGFGIIGAVIGGIFKVGFFLLMFVFFAKMFGFMMWRLAMRSNGHSWGDHRHGWGDGTRDWNPDEMRKKWQERKRAWAKERGYSDTTSEDSGDTPNDGNDEKRPPEERFVV